MNNVNVFKVNNREVIFISMSLFSLFKKIDSILLILFFWNKGHASVLKYMNTSCCVNLWPVTTEHHESHS